MALAPYGVLHQDYKKRFDREGAIDQPPPAWPEDKDAEFKDLMQAWIKEVQDSIWPSWENGTWVGAAAADMEARTCKELKLMVKLYQGGEGNPDTLSSIPAIPPGPNGQRFDQEWHFRVEDALVHQLKRATIALSEEREPPLVYRASRDIGSNYLLYDPDIDISTIDAAEGGHFWKRQGDIRPPISRIKFLFQRPRPWTTAAGMGVDDFRWVIAGGFHASHTGMHPSFISGHCIQGMLGGCSVLDAWLSSGEEIPGHRLRAIQKYMVDWGDRRVFAGVHYPTDNIGSWTLLRQLTANLFQNAERIEEFVVSAITQHSQVFSDVVEHFDSDHPARTMLLKYFPEVTPTS